MKRKVHSTRVEVEVEVEVEVKVDPFFSFSRAASASVIGVDLSGPRASAWLGSEERMTEEPR